jgi:hypothetical protein
MSVEIRYKGRCGNQIFQYVSARIFSEKNKLNLLTNLDCEILKTTDHKVFDEESEKNFTIVNNSFFVDDNMIPHNKKTRYVFDDFFQNCVYINNNKELVHTFFDLQPVKKNEDDIVLSIRLDDKVHSNDLENPETWDNAEIIHPDYYKKILESETFNKVYIVVDNIKFDWEKKYMSNFNSYNPIIISGTPKEDFDFIRSFNKIVTSVSTYSYWAAYLSNAEKIYTFQKAGFLGKNLRSHGNHVKELWNIKNKSIAINEKFYFGE